MEEKTEWSIGPEVDYEGYEFLTGILDQVLMTQNTFCEVTVTSVTFSHKILIRTSLSGRLWQIPSKHFWDKFHDNGMHGRMDEHADNSEKTQSFWS